MHLVILALLMAAHEHPHELNHGNPEDMDGYIAKMEDPSRGTWQKPDEVVRALDLKDGQTVCDIGAGPGYFTLRAARQVGDAGRVYAVDVEPAMLAALREHIAASRLRNITPVLALSDHALLPPQSCDVILIIDTFHHFPDGVKYLRHLLAALKPGGRVVNIDFHKKDLPVGPPVDHKVDREEFVKLAATAGLRVVAEPTFLPYQYFVIMQAK